ncbi:MAG: hypothetical protein LUC97_05460 [Clostridiales bacterium]|nr:hypothetical protein [Clostridiales bacterium]
MKNFYRVEFITKKGGYKEWVIDVDAHTVKGAVNIAKKMWQKDAHMFGIKARRLKDTEEFLYHYFKEI